MVKNGIFNAFPRGAGRKAPRLCVLEAEVDAWLLTPWTTPETNVFKEYLRDTPYNVLHEIAMENLRTKHGFKI